MIIYNVTIKVNREISDEWLSWMQEVHIPDVMATEFFIQNKIFRVISNDGDGGVTYAVQYTCKDMATLHKYQVQHAKRLQKDHTDRYKDKYVAFRTLMEVIA